MQDIGIEISIQKASASRLAQVDFDNIAFGKIYTDHMFLADYADGKWSNFRIQPYGPLPMSPAISALHYGQAIFEGLKAFRNVQNPEEVLVFRPQDNAERFNASAARMCMPELPTDIFLQGMHALIDLDREWVPRTPEGSLYIRPFMFATDPFLGMKPSDTYTFCILTCPVGAYYSKPLNVKVEKHYARTCPGGTGFAKAAGNYAASLLPTKLGAQEGFDQLLWTDSATHSFIEESGTMNVMFQIDGAVVTAPTLPVEDTILRSVTRLSVLEMLNDWGVEVQERHLPVAEVTQAALEGRLQDAFGVGTAVTIAPIASINDEGRRYDVPIDTDKISARIKETLQGIQRGQLPDTKGWTYKI